MITIDGITYPSSATHSGAPWRGWHIDRTLEAYRPRPANDNVPPRYRGSFPALTWLAKSDPAAAAAIHSLSESHSPRYWDKGGADDDDSWEGDALGSPDDRIRIHPDIDDIIAASADGQAVRPKGRLVFMAGPLRSGFPASEKPHRIGGKWYRHGRAVFIVECEPQREGLLAFWLDDHGAVQVPREEREQRSGSRIPIDWRVERYMRKWVKRPRNDRDATLENLYDSECRDFHLRRCGTPLPVQRYSPAGHSRTGIPEEKAELRNWLASVSKGVPVTRLPDGCARSSDWFGRVPGKKQGLSVPEIWRDDAPLPELSPDVSLTVETILARGSCTAVAKAHGVRAARPDRAGQHLVKAAGKAVLAALAANDNKTSEKVAA